MNGTECARSGNCKVQNELKRVTIDSHGVSVQEVIVEWQIIGVRGVVLDGEDGVH